LISQEYSSGKTSEMARGMQPGNEVSPDLGAMGPNWGVPLELKEAYDSTTKRALTTFAIASIVIIGVAGCAKQEPPTPRFKTAVSKCELKG
jgi:hypothetical protein